MTADIINLAARRLAKEQSTEEIRHELKHSAGFAWCPTCKEQGRGEVLLRDHSTEQLDRCALALPQHPKEPA